MPKPTAFHDIPASAYPFVIQLWEPGADRRGPASWETTVKEPGVLQIPGLGFGTWVRVVYADGESHIMGPPGVDPKLF